MACSYSLGLGADGITSGLRLPGAFPVDAASHLALAAAQPNATSVNDVGIKAVCVFGQQHATLDCSGKSWTADRSPAK
jgi:hypothetical protein